MLNLPETIRLLSGARRGTDVAFITPVVRQFVLKVAGMRYLVAWILGVPFGLIVLWFVVGHMACGR
jgi:hypothetical protein